MPQDVAEAGLELPEQTFGSPTGWMCLVAALRLLQAQAIPLVPAGLQRRGPRRSLHCRGGPGPLEPLGEPARPPSTRGVAVAAEPQAATVPASGSSLAPGSAPRAPALGS